MKPGGMLLRPQQNSGIPVRIILTQSNHAAYSMNFNTVGIKVPAAEILKSYLFWGITLYSLLNVSRRFRGTCIHILG
jgi:hypothetical protein